jgi:hypothetical protein
MTDLMVKPLTKSLTKNVLPVQKSLSQTTNTSSKASNLSSLPHPNQVLNQLQNVPSLSDSKQLKEQQQKEQQLREQQQKEQQLREQLEQQLREQQQKEQQLREQLEQQLKHHQEPQIVVVEEPTDNDETETETKTNTENVNNQPAQNQTQLDLVDFINTQSERVKELHANYEKQFQKVREAERDFVTAKFTAFELLQALHLEQNKLYNANIQLRDAHIVNLNSKIEK